MTVFLAACGAPKEIGISSSAGDYVGKDYATVSKELTDLGFKNITTQGLKDLDTSGDTKQGAIETLTVNEADNFEAGTSFPADANIIITYHSVKEATVPSSGDDLQSHEYTILADLFTTAGFTNVSSEEVIDLDPDTTDKEFVNEVSINGNTSFADGSSFPIDAPIKIVCHKTFSKYTVTIHVDCEGNWIFDKYDVDVSVGGETAKRLPHGESADYEYRFTEGKYTITFTDTENRSVESKEEIDVYSDMTVAYKIACHSSSIDVAMQYTDRDIELDEGQIEMASGPSEYKGNYSDVINKLKQLGFTNIKEAPIYDVYTGFLTTEGDTESVSIKGITDFKRGDVFSSDDEVIISYHTSYEKDPSYIAEQEQAAKEANERAEKEAAATAEEQKLNALAGGTLANAIKTIKDMGYKATYTNSSYDDRTDYVENYMEDDYKTKCKVTRVYANASSKTVEVYFTTPQEEANQAAYDKLDAKLDCTTAWIAAEQYGKYEYPYGFKLHYIVGRLAEEPADENTWFLKAECTVENAYGNKLKGTCEAKVTGTTDNPKVVSFYCY